MVDPAGVVMHGLELSGITPGGSVAVIGPGPIGMISMRLARALGARPVAALGEASFALYALQEPLWLWARRLAGDPDGAPSRTFVLAFCAAAALVAVVAERGLERPARRALRAALGAGARGRPRPAARPGPLHVPARRASGPAGGPAVRRGGAGGAA